MVKKDTNRFAADAKTIVPIPKAKVTDITTEQEKRDNSEHERILRELAKNPVR